MPTATSKSKAVKPVSTKQLAYTLADQDRLTKKQGQAMLDSLVGLITKHLKKGERVKIAGLGTLQVRRRMSKPVKIAASLVLPPTSEPLVERIFRKLGGHQALGTDVSSDADLARVVHDGIRLSVLDHVSRAGFSKQEIEDFIIPARTLRHRKTNREPLTLEESDRVVRLTRIQALAEDVFGDVSKANRWLREGLSILDGKSPLDVARTESGARVIEQILAKIDWGAAA
jgi:putative toxin-antitoxin system antitoxin component (TIGR02293 family)